MPTALARRFRVDVSDLATPNAWVPFKGINDFSPPVTPNLQAADDYDTGGWSAFEKTMQAWVATIKALRKTTAGVFDPGQELVRSKQLGFADAARINVRWYDRNGAPEAFQGVAIVGWVPSKTGVVDLDEITCTLTGDGTLAPIVNPGTAATAAIIMAATPSGAAAGSMVQISGSGFAGTTGATGVKFGGVNASSYIVVSDSLIVAIMPAGSAGSAPIVVTNPVGASTAFPYTRA
ncbi:phage tail tube protein [uncultured Microbacterium sp.]|uniref:phage tail tube protein n=1 Tax=uncultured Microbacterium sp. TaxID=191216 RepID=UPI0025CCE811|nr:IPT/TIG domain-containing protein [uncultured Microbacterium sp.]